MGFFEETISSSTVYRGRIVSVREDTARLDNGRQVYREVVDHPGGVTIIPVDGEGRVVAVRQFRYPLGTEMLEVPAGKLERGEEPLACAVRELSEETGISAASIVSLGSIYPSPGFCRERLYIYLATGLTYGEAHPDDDEFLNVEYVPLADFVDMVMRDEIRDAKTAVAVLKAAKYLEDKNG